MFETWAWTEGARRGRKDQILLQQIPKGVQICYLMPKFHWAKVRPLGRVRNRWSPRGVDCVGLRGLWFVVGFLGSHQSPEPSLKSPMSFSLSLSSLLQVFTKYGKCYMFNSGEDGKPLLTTVKGGTGNGLEIMLDIQQDEYLPIWGETGEPGTRTWAVGDG